MIRDHIQIFIIQPGDRLKIKTLSYQYRDSHCKDKTVSQPSYHLMEIPYLETPSIY